MKPTALLRSVPASFTDALVMGERPHLDIARARQQHRRYREVIEAAGYSVHMIDADEDHPDCPFVEDAAVVLDNLAVISRPGAVERRGETEPVAEVLASLMPIRRVSAPATIDGGDVLRIGTTVYVGRSARTNDAGIRQLSEFAAEDGLSVVAVPVRGVLHLKSAVAVLDDRTVLIASDCVDPAVFADYAIVEKVPTEAASVLRLRNGPLAITTTAPETAVRIRQSGFDLVAVDSTEFQAADGGLTCLSILIDG